MELLSQSLFRKSPLWPVGVWLWSVCVVLAFVESSDDEAQGIFGQRKIDVGDSWNPGEAPLTPCSFQPCSCPCFYRVGHSSEAVLPDGHPGLPDLDPERALWAFICGGSRGAVCLQRRGSGAARRGERWGSGRHTGLGVCGLGRLSHSPEVSLGIRISTCSPLLGSSRWDRFGACVRMGTRCHPWHSSSCVWSTHFTCSHDIADVSFPVLRSPGRPRLRRRLSVPRKGRATRWALRALPLPGLFGMLSILGPGEPVSLPLCSH